MVRSRGRVVLAALVIGLFSLSVKQCTDLRVMEHQVTSLEREVALHESVSLINHALENKFSQWKVEREKEHKESLLSLRRIEKELNSVEKDYVCNVVDGRVVRLLHDHHLIQGDSAP